MLDFMKTTFSAVKSYVDNLFDRYAQTVDKTFKKSVADWEQNDRTQLAYIKNRPFYSEIEVNENLSEHIFRDFEDNNGKYFRQKFFDSSIKLEKPLIEGSKYIVTYDGRDFPCKVYSEEGGLFIGANYYYQLDNPDSLPFGLWFNQEWVNENWVAIELVIVLVPSLGTHTFSIREVEESVHTIDKKYLPELSWIDIGTDSKGNVRPIDKVFIPEDIKTHNHTWDSLENLPFNISLGDKLFSEKQVSHTDGYPKYTHLRSLSSFSIGDKILFTIDGNDYIMECYAVNNSSRDWTFYSDGKTKSLNIKESSTRDYYYLIISGWDSSYHGKKCNIYRVNEILYIPDIVISSNIARQIDVDKLTTDVSELTTDVSKRIVSPTASASVGQILSVKTVDSNGKPTEWEAVDLPSGVEITDGEPTKQGTVMTLNPNAEEVNICTEEDFNALREEIDTMFGSYATDVANLIGGIEV